MNDSYDPLRSRLLVDASNQTYVQLANNGKFTVPPGYRQVAAFKAPELLFEDTSSPTSSEQRAKFMALWDPAREQFASSLSKWVPLFRASEAAPVQAQEIVSLSGEVGAELAHTQRRLASLASWPFSCQEVYVGFALESVDGTGPNIVALRGTQTAYEWAIDATALQIDYNPLDPRWGRVHLGFYFFYRLYLSLQVLGAAVKNFAGARVAVTGHSLGAALAVLAAADLSLLAGDLFDGIEMYNYAGPRVGDPAFVGKYNATVPSSYRTVNLGDVVPVLPPTEILGGTFGHVGAEWSYLWQTGNVAGNHSIRDNYLPTVTDHQEVITDVKRKQPTSCVCA